MEINITSSSSTPLEREKNQSPPIPSPTTNINGGSPLHPITPKSTRSHELTNPNPNPNPNNYPTTFVQADSSNFKHVVQMLTGSATAASAAAASGGGGGIPPIKSTSQKKQGFKLYERRNSLKNGLMINTLSSGCPARKQPEMLSPSVLDFPSLALSPVTPMTGDSMSRATEEEEEERAIAEKKFYLHPSPRTTSSGGEPQLLPLFPVTSPRVSGSSSSSSSCT